MEQDVGADPQLLLVLLCAAGTFSGIAVCRYPPKIRRVVYRPVPGAVISTSLRSRSLNFSTSSNSGLCAELLNV